MTAAPLFFHISPDGCGEARLARLFRRNGHAAICHDNGRLAEDILFSRAGGGDALRHWPGTVLFSGLYRHAPHWRPPLEAWLHFPWLAARFPQARFILALRRPEDWILARLTRDGGAVAGCHAHHRGCDTADLPDLWEADWHAHLTAVDAFFGGDPRLIRVDLDRETPADLAARLDPLLPMPNPGLQQGWFPAPKGPPADLVGLLAKPAAEQVDPAYVEDVAAFCLRGLEPAAGEEGGLSEYFSTWDGRGVVSNRHGAPRRIAVQDRLAVSAPDRPFKIIRAEGVINDALRLGRPMALRIDMEDSRWFGSPQGDPLAAPVLCHNRRAGARNAVLWPLPDQHSIGLPGFDPKAVPDPIPWEDKLDQVVWRGMISGSEMTGGVRPGPASHAILRDLAEAGDDPARRQAAWGRLCNTNRLAFLRRWWGHPDFDLGVVMAWGWRDFARDPLLAPYCTPRQDRAFFRRFRYQLCLTGYDHGSNFIGAIDGQSVLLAEEDGWEVFYSGRFQPWKHYIPLERYCVDIAEKLAWARENPGECKAMAAAARAEAALLRRPATRRAIMARILDGLAAAG
ncbi:glycosyl transferase family 90 [Paracoccus benzoatiresistens]|uniref:Glycosyl transferase family 90 n=1 Tax=Paracoccus benzoatiresistens TaxID=2997341 RepID=A0ABT4J1J8_9RHOB|nr:glycosyl transferase family 90 [Paracoccus sp. EF6]MCZ0960515.1 glycosyl transferase family 90 [Paracoccus sp. EF6]